MRMSNLSARMKVNDWLMLTGREPIPDENSYFEFAIKLRKMTTNKNVGQDFLNRADAVSYIRRVAASITS